MKVGERGVLTPCFGLPAAVCLRHTGRMLDPFTPAWFAFLAAAAVGFWWLMRRVDQDD